MKRKITAEKYPSTELAYKIAIDSYELMSKRNEAIDSKIQNSMTVGLTLFVALCTFAKFKNVSFDAGAFAFAALLIILSILLNLYSRIHGEVQHIDPQVMHAKWLHKETVTFQADAVSVAGEAYKLNKKCIEEKWKMLITSLS